MPKILINEIDRTSAGTPGEYSNNSVLICGFSTRTNEEIIATMEKNPNAGFTLPDENGVFEFYSKDDFKDTIGKVAPVFSDGEHVPAHYGNQMAYELLGQGYPCVIYYSLGVVPATADEAIAALKKITDPDNWAIFKDKASYDFRFVTHGLLSAHDTHDVAAAKKAKENAESALTTAQKTLDDALAANEELKATEGYNAESTEAKAAEKAVADAEKKVASANTELSKATAAYEYASASCFTESDFAAANEVITGLAQYVQTEDYEAVPGTGRGDCVALVEVNEAKYVNDAFGRPEAKILASSEQSL